MAKTILPVRVRHWLRIKPQRLYQWPPVGAVRFGSFRRVTPIDRLFGLRRGSCIDRYYIENFLSRHAEDIQGHVLEIGSNMYTCMFGGQRVIQADVLHLTPDNPQATIIADLTRADHIPSNTFDCVCLIQTLQFIYDVKAAMQTLYRILKPRGVVLATLPGISQISRYDMERWGDYWRFTSRSARQLFEEIFPAANVTFETYGNVLVAIAFLHGLAAEELRQQELDVHDTDYEVLITVRAVKSQGPDP